MEEGACYQTPTSFTPPSALSLLAFEGLLVAVSVAGLIAVYTATLVLAPFVGRSRALAWVANGVGFVLLLNVARVALLSAPLPFAWSVTPPLQLPFHLPYALIVPVCVAGALAGHLVLTRRLLLGDGGRT